MEQPDSTRYELIKRTPAPHEAQGREICYDLIVSDGDGRAVLEDVASGGAHALRILRLFEEYRVGSVEAPGVMEDLLGNPDWLEDEERFGV